MASKSTGFGIKIFPKLLMAMIAVALIPLGGLWYINSVRVEEAWQTNIESNLRQTTNTLVDRVESWVDKNLQVLHQNASLEDMQSMEGARQNPILKAIRKAYPRTFLVFTIAPNGQNIGRNDGKPLKFYGDRQYVRQVLQGLPFGQEVLISRTTGKPAFALSVVIRGQNKEIVGVLAMGMTLVEISNVITNIKIGETGFAMLLDAAGQVIAHGQPELLTKTLQDYSDHPVYARAAEGRQLVFIKDGKQVVSYGKKIKQGWTVIVQQDYDEAYAPLREAERNALFVLLATILLVIIVALTLGRRLVKPLESLTKVAGDISRGKLGTIIDETRRGDEIGGLARAIERMGISIQVAFKELRRGQQRAN